MWKMSSLFAKRSIGRRLLLWFLIIACFPTLVAAVVIYLLSREALEDRLRKQMLVVAANKVGILDRYALERIRGITALARAPGVIDATLNFQQVIREHGMESDQYRIVAAQRSDYMGYYGDAFDYRNTLLFAPNGDLLYQRKPDLAVGANLLKGPLRQTELALAFERSRSLIQAEVADFQQYPGLAEPAIFVTGPVLNNGVLVAVMALQIDNQQIYTVLGDYAGLGKTGEALAGTRIGDYAMLVTPTRTDPRAAFRRKFEFGTTMGPIRRAVLGETGYGEAEDADHNPVVAAWIYIPAFRWGLVVQQHSSEAYDLITQQRWALLTLMSITMVPVVILALLVATSIVKPIGSAVNMAQRVAEGDLTAVLTCKHDDETGALLKAINQMMTHLKSLIRRIQESSLSLMSTATEIAATSKQQEETVHEFGASATETAAAVSEITATSQQLSQTMSEVQEAAVETANMAAQGQENLGQMEAAISRLADATLSISSKLSVISERTSAINLVVTTINKVADQTNLLSINAAIEAEKAGEYGLGFLVVAREIRRLADQTAVATLEIERMVKDMQASVAAGVMEMDKFAQDVRQNVHDVRTMSQQLGQIISTVQALTARFQEVNEGMQSNAAGATQIRTAMSRLSDGVGQTAQSLREFNRATDQMRLAVSRLMEEVARFKLE